MKSDEFTNVFPKNCNFHGDEWWWMVIISFLLSRLHLLLVVFSVVSHVFLSRLNFRILKISQQTSSVLLPTHKVRILCIIELLRIKFDFITNVVVIVIELNRQEDRMKIIKGSTWSNWILQWAFCGANDFSTRSPPPKSEKRNGSSFMVLLEDDVGKELRGSSS